MEYEPKQIISEQLRAFENEPSDFETVIKEKGIFWQVVSYKNALPHGARVTTLNFLKERSIPGCQLHAITFLDNAHVTWYLFCLVVQEATGKWRIESCSGQASNTTLSGPRRRKPGIFLFGDWNDCFHAGGFVINDARIDLVKVRLVFSNENFLEDTIQDNVVLFVSAPREQMPIRVEFYTQSTDITHSLIVTSLFGQSFNAI